MRTHRFLVDQKIELKKSFWLHDEELLWQWNKVLRLKSGQEVVLFDGIKTDRLYRIEKISKTEAYLQMISQLERNLPKKHVYLFWALLKRDNNEHIIQKCTEIGVSNFVPLLTERTIKKDFNMQRAQKIIKEASEQCGRSDTPHIREPLHLEKALEEYADKLYFLVCHKGSKASNEFPYKKYGILVGPEGGWSSSEQEMFSKRNLPNVNLGNFILRAETAAVVASSKVINA